MGVDPNKVDWANALLTSIAKKIQLNKSDYEKAVDRYYRIADFLTSSHSFLAGSEPIIYPQGSFRMRSTISAHDREEDFDIDLILEAALDPEADPEDVIDLLFSTLEAGKDKLKYQVLEAKRRCVTVSYQGMHIDITPAVLTNIQNPRVISIFDTHPERQDHPIANPEGFAQWFDQRVLPAQYLVERGLQAKTYPVPDQEPLEDKPLRIQSLQLLKRYRDICCDAKGYDRCPSVLLSKLSATAASVSTGGLIADLAIATRHVRDKLNVPEPYEENPRCSEDIFTDRWPNSTGAHKQFVRDLDALLVSLDKLVESGSLEDKQRLLEKLFGERATRSAFKDVTDEFANKAQAGSLAAIKGVGGIAAPISTPKVVSQSVHVPPHKFYGA